MRILAYRGTSRFLFLLDSTIYFLYHSHVLSGWYVGQAAWNAKNVFDDPTNFDEWWYKTSLLEILVRTGITKIELQNAARTCTNTGVRVKWTK